MREQIRFTLQFVFEDKDSVKALKLHKLLKQFGAVSNIEHSRKLESGNKLDRMASILNVMRPGKIYTTGKLWCRFGHANKCGVKTFQRDLNTLAIEGRIEGVSTHSHGNTVLWSRRY